MKKFLVSYSIYLILILSFLLRINGLDARDFWLDEAFTGLIVKSSFFEVFEILKHDFHPPLYFLIAKILSYPLNYSVVGIRLVSVLFGVLGVWAVYMFTKELFGRIPAIWAALITCISPFAIGYSQEARMYSMLAFLIVMSSYFFMRALKRNKTYDYIMWGLFLGLSFMTQYISLIFLPIFYIVYLFWSFLKNKKYSLRLFLPDKKMVLGYIVSIICFTPWIFNFFNIYITTEGDLGWIPSVTFADVFKTVQIFMFGSPSGVLGAPPPNGILWASDATVFSITIIFICAVAILLAHKEKLNFVVVSIFSFGFIIVVYLLSLRGEHLFISRYLIPAAYFLYAAIGAWMYRIGPKLAVLFGGIYLFFIFSISPNDASHGYSMLVNSEKYKENNFYVLEPFNYIIAKYYLGADKVYLYNINNPTDTSLAWSGVGGFNRVEDFLAIKNDPRGVLISDNLFPIQENRNFDPKKMVLLGNYDNLKIYKLKK